MQRFSVFLEFSPRAGSAREATPPSGASPLLPSAFRLQTAAANGGAPAELGSFLLDELRRHRKRRGDTDAPRGAATQQKRRRL